MENKLQELTKKLYDEGLEKGRAEADRLVGEAKNEAAKIVAEARAQAEEIVKKARDKAEDVEKNTMTEIALAGKQAAAKIKSEIASMIVAKATAAGVKEAALDPAFIKEMLLAVAGNWNGADAGKVELKALLPEAERTKLDVAFGKSARELLAAGIEVGYSKEVKSDELLLSGSRAEGVFARCRHQGFRCQGHRRGDPRRGGRGRCRRGAAVVRLLRL